MARPGISKKQVFNAANQLVGEGKDPTIEQIRLILKTGSNSTIAGHLRDWRASLNDNQSITIIEGLPQEMVGMMKGLWERLSVQADLKTTEAEKHYERIIGVLQHELQKYKNNNRRWQKFYNQWQQEKAKYVIEQQAMQQQIESLQDKLDIKQAKLEELQQLEIQQAHHQIQQLKRERVE